MRIDFSTPMTFYELLAIVLAAIAIIIPIGQAAYKKWFIKPKLCFFPTGRALLFFNQSGSYIRIDGVYEAENKPITIRKILVKVTRQKDENRINLTWSSFISPVNQNMVGNYLQTTESAHPFRIEADGVTCAFTEFGDMFDSFGKAFKSATDELFNKISEIRCTYQDYQSAVAAYKKCPEYENVNKLLCKEFFWEIGKYDIDIEVSCGKANKHFCYTISVGEHENRVLAENIDESLLSPLKRAYGVSLNYCPVIVELQTK